MIDSCSTCMQVYRTHMRLIMQAYIGDHSTCASAIGVWHADYYESLRILFLLIVSCTKLAICNQKNLTFKTRPTVLIELWFKEVKQVHRVPMTWSPHGQISMAAAHTKVSSNFFLQFCVLLMFGNACLLVLFHWNIGCCSYSSSQLRSSLTLWAGPCIYHNGEYIDVHVQCT